MHRALDSYSLDRPKLVKSYIDKMCSYLHIRYPDQSEETIFSFVDSYVKKNIKRPNIQIINHPSYGNAELKTVDLLEYTHGIGQRIITPSGSIYKTPDEKESMMKLKILDNIKLRKKEKDIMLDAASRGDLITEQRSNNKQASIKIDTNSISGAMANIYNVLFDIPGYNAITSVGRQSVMCGYAKVEQFIEGNMYFPNLNAILNYCVQMHDAIPQNLMDLIYKYALYIPTKTDLYNYIMNSAKFYMLEASISDKLIRFIDTFPEASRVFVFYGACFSNFLKFNDTFARAFFTDFFDVDRLEIDPNIEPKKIYKVDGELLAMILAINSEYIHHAKLEEAIEKYPDGIRKLIAISQHMQKRLDDITDLLTALFFVEVDTPEPLSQFNMIRKTVVVSDTDSVILSTQSLVIWYTGSITFDKPAYEINAFSFYLVSNILKHVFARLSVGIGVTGEDVGRIAMKNEYLYPLFFRTPNAKHYIGLITVQEGHRLPKPKLDIKGLELRGSTVSAETRTATEVWAKWLLDTVMANGTVTARECIAKVVEQEMKVYNSIMSGSKTYLTTASVKTAEEYANAGSSNYFYYELWTKVFADSLGPFILPNKGYSFSVLNEGEAIRNKKYLDFLESKDKKIAYRLTDFLDKYPDKKINILIIPPTISRTPDILKPLIDIRKIIYANIRPYTLLLRSLGIALTNSDKMLLYSDFYEIDGVKIPM